MKEQDIEFLIERAAFKGTPDSRLVAESAAQNCVGLQRRCHRYRKALWTVRYVAIIPLAALVFLVMQVNTPRPKYGYIESKSQPQYIYGVVSDLVNNTDHV